MKRWQFYLLEDLKYFTNTLTLEIFTWTEMFVCEVKIQMFLQIYLIIYTNSWSNWQELKIDRQWKKIVTPFPNHPWSQTLFKGFTKSMAVTLAPLYKYLYSSLAGSFNSVQLRWLRSIEVLCDIHPDGTRIPPYPARLEIITLPVAKIVLFTHSQQMKMIV